MLIFKEIENFNNLSFFLCQIFVTVIDDLLKREQVEYLKDTSHRRAKSLNLTLHT